MNTKKVSRFLSLVLRHKPETIGLRLDENGWADVDDLLSKMARNREPITRDQLDEVVRTNDKQRFAFSEDGSRIRANQGHSIEVDLVLNEKEPPEILYHGTIAAVLDSIRNLGITKQQRHHVHLSEELETANKVGSRRGKPVILKVQSQKMYSAGHQFYVSKNGVWLTETVPPEFVLFP